jgi:hypothetical protein
MRIWDPGSEMEKTRIRDKHGLWSAYTVLLMIFGYDVYVVVVVGYDVVVVVGYDVVVVFSSTVIRMCCVQGTSSRTHTSSSLLC